MLNLKAPTKDYLKLIFIFHRFAFVYLWVFRSIIDASHANNIIYRICRVIYLVFSVDDT